MKYNLDMTIRRLCEDPGACEVFDRLLPGMRETLAGTPMAAGLSIRKLLSFTGGAVSREVCEALDEQLREYGKTAGLTEAEKAKIAAYQEIAEADRQRAADKKNTGEFRNCAFYPGRPWLDTAGERIQAHGGALHYEDGVYYWYGENKAHTDGKCSIWTWGIRVYRSTDLYNWEDLGLLIEPVLEDPNSSLFPDMRVDRPHIRRCGATGKYVAWIKLSGEEACFLIMQADRFLGPYQIVRENYRPMGYKVGDFDIVQDAETGKSYLYMDADHQGIICAQMAEDMLSAENMVSRQYAGLMPPFCREGIAMLERDGMKYMFTSGMTGYLPNQSDCASSSSWREPFVSLGDPYVDDSTMASFNSQFTQVFRLPDRDFYIALADRWVPGYPVDGERADLLRRCVASRYDPKHFQATEQEQMILAAAPMLETADTSIADYVWLPIAFAESGEPKILWKDYWTID